MSWQDLINGAFELMGGWFILVSVLKLLREKRAHGIHWLTTSFFISWGVWNLYYYPHLGQWASFAGGAFLVITNIVWLGLIIYYRKGR